MTGLVWTVAETRGHGGQVQAYVFVLPVEVARYWQQRRQVLTCGTWGEVRRLGDEIYAEVLGLAGYGKYDDLVGHFSIEGTAPGLSPSPVDEAEHLLRSLEELPSDESEFQAYDDLAACADGDWPPSIFYLMAEHVPKALVERYGTSSMTNFNGLYASLDGSSAEEVLAVLTEQGHELSEAPWLTQLLDV